MLQGVLPFHHFLHSALHLVYLQPAMFAADFAMLVLAVLRFRDFCLLLLFLVIIASLHPFGHIPHRCARVLLALFPIDPTQTRQDCMTVPSA